MTTYNSTQILEGLKTKNAEVFRYLYRTYGNMIVRYVRKNSGSDEDAQEMVQVVILEFWQSVRDNRYREEGKMERYIYQLTANSWREELRRRRNRPQTSLEDQHTGALRDDSVESAEAALQKDQQLVALEKALSEMGSPCKEIITLYHLQETALQDVAKQMDYDYNNLRKRIFDCRKKLRRMAEEYL
jgi:RNA polymerase sigma factor (sigma-70 family)